VIALPELPQQRPADRCLARSHLACQANEPFTLPEAVKKVVQRLTVLVRHVKEARIRGYVERVLSEPVVLLVHDYNLLPWPAVAPYPYGNLTALHMYFRQVAQVT